MTRIGVLALQGDFAAHAASLRRAGARVVEVRHTDQIDGVAGLVIPGGESTTLLNLMGDEAWFETLRGYHDSGGALFGTCAGAILLSREVQNPRQPSLDLIDAVIERNAWGRQVDSFETTLEMPVLGDPLHVAFIRAPRFRDLGPQVETLASFEGEPVLIRQGRVLAGTFHSELNGDDRLHRYFMEMTGEVRAADEDGRAAIAAT